MMKSLAKDVSFDSRSHQSNFRFQPIRDLRGGVQGYAAPHGSYVRVWHTMATQKLRSGVRAIQFKPLVLALEPVYKPKVMEHGTHI
jgi:hypothetical protein